MTFPTETEAFAPYTRLCRVNDTPTPPRPQGCGPESLEESK